MPSKNDTVSMALEYSEEHISPVLHRLRNMWQFANLCQWIYIFGKAANIDESVEIEDLETECLKPSSTLLPEIGLALLKLVSSHRGLTHDIFDDQLRKHYISKLPQSNPLGSQDDDSCKSFATLDVYTKVIVLQQLTQWTMVYPERIRDKMEEQKDFDQTAWRIEPYGWDKDDRTYFVLDDNRVYRLSEPLPTPKSAKPAKKRKSYSSGRRSSKRRRTIQAIEDNASENADDDASDHDERDKDTGSDPSLGGMTWECVAVTLPDVQHLLEMLHKSKDQNERVLRTQLEKHLLPILEKQEESRKRKEAQRERELLSLAKMAGAKRSSRIAHKSEQKKQNEQVEEEQERSRQEAKARRQEEAKQEKLDVERDRRLFARERRLKEREVRRHLHEEELAQLSEDSKTAPDGTARMSERYREAEIKRTQQALEDITQEEEDWIFDCVCGLYGQVDDGAHSVACERCNVWQHSKCLGIAETEAESPEFRFLCSSCRHRLETPRKSIKIKIRHSNGSEKQLQETPAQTDKFQPVTDLNLNATENGEQKPLSIVQHEQKVDAPATLGSTNPSSQSREDLNNTMAHGPTTSTEGISQRQPHIIPQQPQNSVEGTRETQSQLKQTANHTAKPLTSIYLTAKPPTILAGQTPNPIATTSADTVVHNNSGSKTQESSLSMVPRDKEHQVAENSIKDVPTPAPETSILNESTSAIPSFSPHTSTATATATAQMDPPPTNYNNTPHPIERALPLATTSSLSKEPVSHENNTVNTSHVPN